MKVSKAFKWYAEHPKELQSYAGKHVAIVNDGVAAAADTAEKAYKLAKRKYPAEVPALIYIPEGDTLVFYEKRIYLPLQKRILKVTRRDI